LTESLILKFLLNINKLDTTRVYIIYLQAVVFRSDYMFRLSSLCHHQVVSLYRGNCTIQKTYKLMMA